MSLSNSEVTNRGKLRKIIYEERVYRDVFPFIRLYQGFWLAAVVFFCLLSLIPVFHWHSYRQALAATGSLFGRTWILLCLNFLGLLVYLVLSLWVGLAICRMKRWIGVVALLYCIPALAFCGVIFAVVIWESVSAHGTLSWVLPAGASLFVVPFGYFCWRGAMAGRRFAFVSDETRHVVSEIYTQSNSRSGWLSKALGLPFPMEYIGKNKVLSTVLFVFSGMAFSSFALFAVFAPGFAMAPLLVGPFIFMDAASKGSSATGLFGNDFLAAMLRFMAYSPLIFAGLAVTALIVANVARARARRLMIASIVERQQSDDRKPILFLRPFYDDRVRLAAPRLSLFGRLVNLTQAKASLDILLLEEATAFGPVVAVGNPEDPIPDYGAARGYFSNQEWHKGVADLANNSLRIFLCLDTTGGVLWELDHLVRRGHIAKTLFLFHPSAKEHAKNREIRTIITRRIQLASSAPLDFGDIAASVEPVLGFFFAHSQLQFGVSAEFSEASYLLMTRWFLRTLDDGFLAENLAS